MLYLIIFALILISLAIANQAIIKNMMKPPKNYPNVGAIIPNKKILVCAGDSAGAGELTSSDGWRGNVKKQVRSFEGSKRTHDGFEGRMDQCMRPDERTN